MGRDTSHQTRYLQDPSILNFEHFGAGTCTTPLGNLFHCLTTLTVKNFFLISNLNFLPFNLYPLLLGLSLQDIRDVLNSANWWLKLESSPRNGLEIGSQPQGISPEGREGSISSPAASGAGCIQLRSQGLALRQPGKYSITEEMIVLKWMSLPRP